jgi:type I restriction enzyme R subunit
LNLQGATLDQEAAGRAALIERIQNLAHGLEAAANVPVVKEQLGLIHAVQGDEYWQDATLPMIENMRRRLRGLIQFIDKKSSQPVYSALDDEMGEATPVTLNDFQTGVNLAQYRRKVESFIRANAQHVAIAKLKHNRPLTPSDLAELEQFVYEADEVGGRERFVEGFGEDTPLTVFIRSLVGLDEKAAKDAFAEFIGEQRLDIRQINFVEMIVEHLTRQGTMEPGQLYEAPFTGLHFEGIDGVFAPDRADRVVSIVRAVNANAQNLARRRRYKDRKRR